MTLLTGQATNVICSAIAGLCMTASVASAQHNHYHPPAGSSYVVPSQGNTVGTYYYSNGQSYFHNHHQGHPPAQVTFGGFGHVDELAHQLEVYMNEICLDLHYNYRHNYGFAETYKEAYQLLETAKFVHGAEHHQDRDAIRARLGGMDSLFHHVEDDVKGWSRVHHVQVGNLGIITKMEQAEATLHHLMNDVGVSASPGLSEVAPPPGGAGGVQVAPPPQ